jgi:hypothetical protein
MISRALIFFSQTKRNRGLQKEVITARILHAEAMTRDLNTYIIDNSTIYPGAKTQ